MRIYPEAYPENFIEIFGMFKREISYFEDIIMEDRIKDRIILILAILSGIFFISTVGSCSNVNRLKVARDKEMETRLNLEEKMSKSLQESKINQDKLNSLAQELEAEKLAHQAVRKELIQEGLMVQSLKTELAKMIELKQALEEDLK